jgi:predicted transposase/invertase (TIGR01784 family)
MDMEHNLAIARKEGIEKGIEKGKLEVARNMLKLGLPVETIAEASGLSRGEVLGLSN